MTSKVTAPVKLPLVANRALLPAGVHLAIELPADLTWFTDHFPDDPVLPGAAQVGWAISYARAHFGFEHDPVTLDQVKFQRPIRPGAHLELELIRDVAQPSRVTWHLREEGGTVGTGRMDFSVTC